MFESSLWDLKQVFIYALSLNGKSLKVPYGI